MTIGDNERDQLGESLYLKVMELQPELAGKITGMMLDTFEDAELMSFMQDGPVLTEKIEQAMKVLAEDSDTNPPKKSSKEQLKEQVTMLQDELSEAEKWAEDMQQEWDKKEAKWKKEKDALLAQVSSAEKKATTGSTKNTDEIEALNAKVVKMTEKAQAAEKAQQLAKELQATTEDTVKRAEERARNAEEQLQKVEEKTKTAQEQVKEAKTSADKAKKLEDQAKKAEAEAKAAQAQVKELEAALDKQTKKVTADAEASASKAGKAASSKAEAGAAATKAREEAAAATKHFEGVISTLKEESAAKDVKLELMTASLQRENEEKTAAVEASKKTPATFAALLAAESASGDSTKRVEAKSAPEKVTQETAAEFDTLKRKLQEAEALASAEKKRCEEAEARANVAKAAEVEAKGRANAAEAASADAKKEEVKATQVRELQRDLESANREIKSYKAQLKTISQEPKKEATPKSKKATDAPNPTKKEATPKKEAKTKTVLAPPVAEAAPPAEAAGPVDAKKAIGEIETDPKENVTPLAAESGEVDVDVEEEEEEQEADEEETPGSSLQQRTSSRKAVPDAKGKPQPVKKLPKRNGPPSASSRRKAPFKFQGVHAIAGCLFVVLIAQLGLFVHEGLLEG